MKKHIRVVAILVVLILSLISFAACSPRVREDGDFLYVIQSKRVHLRGLSEKGKQKEVLVIPQYIKGKEVITMYQKAPLLGNLVVSQLDSLNLKKVFMLTSDFIEQSNPFGGSKNLKKIIKIPINFYELRIPIYNGVKGFIPYYSNYKYSDFIGNNKPTNYANTSYMWNYEGSEQNNEGYYWVDDYDYGNTISIPPSPNRSGYTFDGWYKEPSCGNKWNFEVDTLPEEILEEKQNDKGEIEFFPVYQNTYLYAKWTKN